MRSSINVKRKQKHSLQLLGTKMQSLCCPTCTLPTILCDPDSV